MIVTALAASDSMSFAELKEETDLTNGNLSSHLKKLDEKGLIKIKKQFVENRPLTTVHLTANGRSELKSYVTELRTILERVLKVT